MNAGKRGIMANEEIESRMVDVEKSELKELKRERANLAESTQKRLAEIDREISRITKNLVVDTARLKQTQNGHPTPNEPFKNTETPNNPNLSPVFVMQPCKGNNLH